MFMREKKKFVACNEDNVTKFILAAYECSHEDPMFLQHTEQYCEILYEKAYKLRYKILSKNILQ